MLKSSQAKFRESNKKIRSSAIPTRDIEGVTQIAIQPSGRQWDLSNRAPSFFRPAYPSLKQRLLIPQNTYFNRTNIYTNDPMLI